MTAPLLGIAICTMAGCEAQPRIRYTSITQPSDRRGDEFDAYALQASIIRIGPAPSSTELTAGRARVARTALTFRDFQAESLPKEAEGMKLGMARADGFGVRTNVTISKMPNTSLIAQAGVEVTDNRVEYIKAAGQIVASAIPLVAAANAGRGIGEGYIPVEQLPVDVDVAAMLPADRDPVNIPVKPGLTVSIGRVPADAVALADLRFPLVTSDLLVSACRTATVRASLSSGAAKFEFVSSLKIADPQFIQRVSLPTKGNVAMHSQCGFSVVASPSPGTSGGLDIVAALLAQGKAIKDALDTTEAAKRAK